MEMTFPSLGAHRDKVNRLGDHRAILAAAGARQAKSRTVRMVRQAEQATLPTGNEAEQRINYFADNAAPEMAVRGAFWRDTQMSEQTEPGVYQSGLVNFKDLCLEPKPTGEQTTLAGQGRSRKL